MGVEPWGLYPPEINAGRYESGVGAPTWVASALKWTAFAGLVAESNAVFGAQVVSLTGNWEGVASNSYAAATAPFAAWLADMQTLALTNAAAEWEVLQAYGVGMATMVPLPIIIANRIAARTAQIIGVLGMPNTEMVRLEIEYAAYWVHNALVMTGYDVAVNTATAPKPAPPPPPLVIDGGASAVGSGIQAAGQNALQALSRGSSSLNSAGSQAASAVQRAFSPTQFQGPGSGDTGMWNGLLGGGAGAGGLGAFGGGGGGLGGGIGAGGGGVGMAPSQAPLAAMSKPTPVAAAIPTGGFGGVQNAPTATRPSMPMMPPPHGAGNKNKNQEVSSNSAPIIAAEQEFPAALTTGLMPPENPPTKTVAATV